MHVHAIVTVCGRCVAFLVFEQTPGWSVEGKVGRYFSLAEEDW